MKKIILTIIFIFNISLSASTIVDSDYFLNKTITWDKKGSPYIIKGNLTLVSSTLNIYDAEIIMENSTINLFNNSSLNIKSTDLKSKNSIKNINSFNSKIDIDDLVLSSGSFIEAYNSDISITNLQSSTTNSHNLFSLYDSSNLSLVNSYIENYKGIVFNLYHTNNINIQSTEFVNNQKVIYLGFSEYLKVNNNDFEKNNIAIDSYMYNFDNKDIDFENNFFEKDRPIIHMYESDTVGDLGNLLIGPFNIKEFSKVKNIDRNKCCSNIIFLPGMMGSRLYTDGLTENQLWEPNKNADVKKLYLNDLGQSLYNIFTKDIIIKTNIFGGLPNIDKDIYKDFANYLDKIKKDKIINNYYTIPYDWRMSPDHILTEGIKFKKEGDNIDLIQSVKDIQKTSKTGKVTLITHSNGGLIAKKLFIELKKQGLENIIDKIIFVAMPEYGTPQAITALMFGHNQSLGGGLIMRSSIARELGKNMPTAYTLLPSEKYYTYDNNLDKYLHQIAVKNYSKTNADLLNKAKSLHEEIDNIIYPENVGIYQIIGTGINTMSDIKLDDKLKYKLIPIYNKSGDGVVQDLFSSRKGKVFYVDLKEGKYKHVNIMNHDKVINYINNIIKPPKIDYGIGLDYYKVVKNNNYSLLQMSQSDNITIRHIGPLDISLSLGMTSIDNNSFIDKYNSNTSGTFDNIAETSNNNRFELYGDSINYLYTDDIKDIILKTRSDNLIDISFIKNIDGEISELEYKNIPIYKNSEMRFESSDDFNSLDVKLPLTNQIINLQNESNMSKVAKSTHEIISEIISNISTSKMEKYLKDRYIRRVEIYKKDESQQYLTVLKKRISDAISSIGNLSYSSALRSRYSKIKEDYIYLNLLLLKL